MGSGALAAISVAGLSQFAAAGLPESAFDQGRSRALDAVMLTQTEGDTSRHTINPETDYRPGQFVSPLGAGVATDDERLIEGEGFSATYVDADVRLVVNQILGGFLGLDYTIAPDISGVVTMRISDVRTRRGALEALRASLNPLGIVVVERGDFVAIVRGAGNGVAGMVAVIAPGEPAPAGSGAAVLTPRYVAPSELTGLVAPFAPPSTIALADDERRILILRGEEAAITAASEAVALFDVDWFAQVSTGVFPLEYAAPGELAGELRPLLGPAAGEVELVPIPRLSLLVALARRPDVLRVVSGWVEELDVSQSSAPADGLLLYEARYADAEALAATVGRLMGASVGMSFGAEGMSAGEYGAGQIGAGSFPPLNGLAGAGRPLGPGGSSFEAEQPLAVSSPLSSPAPGSAAYGGPSFMITAEPDQNMVIARGDEEQITEVRTLLEALDHPRAQVLIEATIVEVTLNDELRYGVNWAGLEDERLEVIFSDAPDGAVVSRFPGFSVSYVNVDIAAALNLLSSITTIEVVSRPSVIALNNETAALQIGDQVPIVTQSAVSVIDPGAPIVNQTSYRDTGVILSVVPHVRAGGVVEIEIAQEVSDVARTTTSGIDSPTISQRRIESRLVVPSGGSVALGGLISSSRATGETGVPVLRRAPVVGRLFRSESDVRERTELIVFLTPRVLATPNEAVDATAEMRAAMGRLEALLANGP